MNDKTAFYYFDAIEEGRRFSLGEKDYVVRQFVNSPQLVVLIFSEIGDDLLFAASLKKCPPEGLILVESDVIPIEWRSIPEWGGAQFLFQRPG